MAEGAVLKGKLGRVSCSIPPDGSGEVLIEVRGGAETFTAYPAEPEKIATGRTVVVVEQLSPRSVLVTPYWNQGD
ncbi:MAG TPA: hypothetical protein VG476_05485 [Acidimicrobiales bacterium]|nr:hypothetical protein [Acidimicrobiales bacterium]